MTSRLAIGPGDGLVVRLDHELLFLPEPGRDRQLGEAFVEAGPGARIDAVIDLLETGHRSVPPIVMVGWIGRIRLVVGGEIEISAEPSKVAALSRPGAHQWLERTLAAETVVDLQAGGAAIRSDSELIAGAVPAGSIHLGLNDRSIPVQSIPARPTPPLAVASSIVVGDEIEAQTPEDATRGPEPAAEPPHRTPPPVPTGTERGTLTWEPDFDDPLDDPDQPTFMPQRVSGLLPTGRIRFDDGTIERLDRPIVIGRGPSPQEVASDARAVSWDVPSVSRVHVEVRPKGDGAEIIDLGSRNGTFVVNLSATDLVALEPHVPCLISAGIQVLLGERHFVFEVVTG